MHNPESVLENEMHKFLGQTTRPYDSQQQQQQPQQQNRTCQIVDFTVPVDHRVKLKESEKKSKVPRLC